MLSRERGEFRYCQDRQVGATYDTNADKWEAHGPVTEAEWLEALSVMDARLEAASEVDCTTAEEQRVARPD